MKSYALSRLKLCFIELVKQYLISLQIYIFSIPLHLFSEHPMTRSFMGEGGVFTITFISKECCNSTF